MKLRFDERGIPLVSLEEGESAVAISDTHLGSRTNAQRACDVEALCHFLQDLYEGQVRVGGKTLKSPSLLVLLGDILEFWCGDPDIVLRDFYPVARIILPVPSLKLYIAGNHDKIVGKIALEATGGKLDFLVAPEYAILESGGRKFALAHGHQFDSLFCRLGGLWKLESYLYSIAEGLRSLPGPSEWYLAMISAASGAALLTYGELLGSMPGLVKPLVYVAPLILMLPLAVMVLRRVQDKLWYLLLLPLSSLLGFKRAERLHPSELLERGLVRKWMRAVELEADGVLFGHTHVPGIAVQDGLLAANAGSWIAEEGLRTFLYVEEGKVLLVKFDGNSRYSLLGSLG